MGGADFLKTEYKPLRAILTAGTIVALAYLAGPSAPAKPQKIEGGASAEAVNKKIFSIVKQRGLTADKVKTQVCTSENFSEDRKQICESLVNAYAQEYANAAAEHREPKVSLTLPAAKH